MPEQQLQRLGQPLGHVSVVEEQDSIGREAVSYLPQLTPKALELVV